MTWDPRGEPQRRCEHCGCGIAEGIYNECLDEYWCEDCMDDETERAWDRHQQDLMGKRPRANFGRATSESSEETEMTDHSFSPAKLLPCPFCGSPARADLLPHAGGPGWVQCSECELTQHMSDTLEEAVKRWNTRAALSQGGSSDQAWQAVRDTVADEWGSHVCYTDSFGVRSCGKNNPNLGCRCADIAKAVVSVHGINVQVERMPIPQDDNTIGRLTKEFAKLRAQVEQQWKPSDEELAGWALEYSDDALEVVRDEAFLPKSAPAVRSSLPSGESDPSVTLDCAGADTKGDGK